MVGWFEVAAVALVMVSDAAALRPVSVAFFPCGSLLAKSIINGREGSMFGWRRCGWKRWVLRMPFWKSTLGSPLVLPVFSTMGRSCRQDGAVCHGLTNFLPIVG